MADYNEFQIKYWKQAMQYTDNVIMPGTWNTLTKKQLLYVAEYWESWSMLLQVGETLIKAKALLLIELISSNAFADRMKKIFYINQLDNESQYALCELTDFIFEKNTLTKNLFPIIRFDKQELCGPPDRLAGMTANEFSFADGMFLNYSKTKDIKYLDKMIAILYRPGSKKNGDDRRNPFDRNFIGDNLQLVEKLSYEEKQAILLFYMGCRNSLVTMHQGIFDKGQSNATNKSWIDVIMAMSGGKFGNFKETSETDITLIFKELQELQNKKP